MWFGEDNFSVKIGSNTYINVPNILVYKGDIVFTINRAERTDLLGIDFKIYNYKGEKIAVVKNGRIYEGNKDRYKVDVGPDGYSLTDKETNEVICNIKKRTKAEGAELEVNVNLYMNDGFFFKLTPEQTNFPGMMVKNSIIKNSLNGIVIN